MCPLIADAIGGVPWSMMTFLRIVIMLPNLCFRGIFAENRSTLFGIPLWNAAGSMTE